jgi:hypothetical protein
MKLFKNKKGDAGDVVQEKTFYLAELLLGALLIAGGIYLVIDLTGASQTEMITKDLAELISTISHQSQDITYMYLFPEFVSHVSIKKDTVTIYSDKGRSTHRLKLNKDITFFERDFASPKFIPIFFSSKEKTLMFEPKQAASCGNMQLLKENTKFKITTTGTPQEKQELESLKQFMGLVSVTKDIYAETRTNYEIELSFNRENNFTMTIPEATQFQAMYCYAQNMFPDENRPFENQEISRIGQNKITIQIGSFDELNNQPRDEKERILTLYATEIHETISRGIAT